MNKFLLVSLMLALFALTSCELMNTKLEEPSIPQQTVPSNDTETAPPTASLAEQSLNQTVNDTIQQNNTAQQTIAETTVTEVKFNLMYFPDFYESIDLMTFLDKEQEVKDLVSMLESKGIKVRLTNPYDQPNVTKDTILIVESCHSLVEDFVLFDDTCNIFLDSNKGLIKLNDWNPGEKVIVVTATKKETLLKTVSVLTDYQNYKLQGDEITVIKTDGTLLALPTNDFD